MRDDFAAFILTHGRPDNVKTYDTLRKCGYTGAIYLIVDDEDKSLEDYRARYGAEVIVFDKAKEAETTDRGDNFESLGTVLFARNACFKIARQLGLRYFIELDDDYNALEYRYDSGLRYGAVKMHNVDRVFEAMIDFLGSTRTACVCMTQGGDFLGGRDGSNINCKSVTALRKAMNSFVCDVDRPIDFLGRLNDDVNTYVVRGREGLLMFSTTQVSLVQSQTQQNAGGLTEAYLEAGTYAKSFYTVMMQPSSVRIGAMGDTHMRIHHQVKWSNTVPKILREDTRRQDGQTD
jgi:hypothetical protein